MSWKGYWRPGKGCLVLPLSWMLSPPIGAGLRRLTQLGVGTAGTRGSTPKMAFSCTLLALGLGRLKGRRGSSGTLNWKAHRWPLLHVCSQGSWTTYKAAQSSTANFPENKVETAWPFMPWLWKSRSVTSTVLYWLKNSQALPGEET